MKTLREKQISVSFIITRNEKCILKDPHKGLGYEIYEKIARETNGFIVKLHEFDVETGFSIFVDQIDPKYEVLLIKDFPKSSEVKQEISVNKMDKLVITSTGTGYLYVIDPNEKEHTSVITGSINQITVMNPIEGKWLIFTNSSESFTIHVGGISDVIYEYGFSIVPVETKEESHIEPQEGEFFTETLLFRMLNLLKLHPI